MASEMALCLGIGSAIQIDGRCYTISQFTWGMFAQFEEYCRCRIWDDVQATQRNAEPEDMWERYEAAAKHSIPACERGKHLFEEAWTSREGFEFQAWLRFHRYHPEVTPERVKEWLAGPHGAGITARIVEMEKLPPAVVAKKESVAPKKPLPFRSVCALLAGDPWCRTEEQVANMTPWQTNEICFHARHSEGEKIGQIVHAEAETVNVQDLQQQANEFAEQCKARGMTVAQMDKAWRDRLERM